MCSQSLYLYRIIPGTLFYVFCVTVEFGLILGGNHRILSLVGYRRKYTKMLKIAEELRFTAPPWLEPQVEIHHT